jgi:hypothetical protein
LWIGGEDGSGRERGKQSGKRFFERGYLSFVFRDTKAM